MPLPTDPMLDRKVQVLKAMGHPIRLRLVAVLASGDTHVNALAEELEVPQSIVSQQLRILRMSGLVDVKRRDGFAFYTLVERHLVDLLKCMERCCAED
jgi:ArsR family transcriptional regulator